MKKIIVIMLFLVIHCYGESNNQKKENLNVQLTEAGFENVLVQFNDSVIRVEYENRVYRFDVEALHYIIKIIAPFTSVEQKIILIQLKRNIPLFVYEIKSKECKDYLSGKITPSEFADRLKINIDTDSSLPERIEEERKNSSMFRFDLSFMPSINLEFGPFSDPVLYQISLVPELRTTLWKGMSLNYEVILPLLNKFGERGDSIRPGIISLNQTVRLPDNYFVSSSIGIFSQNRYGFDTEIRKYFLNGELVVTGDIGCTGYLLFSSMSRYYYNKILRVTGSIALEYRISALDMSVGIMGGKFLMGDESVRIDFTKEIGETSIGVFAVKSTDGHTNGGVRLSIPIFPSKHLNPGFVRIKTGDEFERSYLMKTNTDELIGLRYNTGNRLDSFTKNLSPAFIKGVLSNSTLNKMIN